jgi:hypothetical protein
MLGLQLEVVERIESGMAVVFEIILSPPAIALFDS